MCVNLQTNNFIQESVQRTEQLKRQQLMKAQRDRDAKCAKETRRYIEIGRLVCKHFPSLLDCQSVSGKESANNLAFLEFVLKLHCDHPDPVRRLRDTFEHQNL